ncbi:MAG: hypothetical protein K0S32_1687 [Bacteroidetes bacterium]|jgi:hypothetical protein|nr:hypothetical protein [Bacteroidota bacterium]
MKWYNVSIDSLPGEGQEVLISFEGIYYVATYDRENGIFYPRNSSRVSIDAKNNLIYWAEIKSPDEGV